MSKPVTGKDKQMLSDEYLAKVDAYWRAANYLAAAQLIRSKRRSSGTGVPFRGRTLCTCI